MDNYSRRFLRDRIIRPLFIVVILVAILGSLKLCGVEIAPGY